MIALLFLFLGAKCKKMLCVHVCVFLCIIHFQLSRLNMVLLILQQVPLKNSLLYVTRALDAVCKALPNLRRKQLAELEKRTRWDITIKGYDSKVVYHQHMQI